MCHRNQCAAIASSTGKRRSPLVISVALLTEMDEKPASLSSSVNTSRLKP